MRERITAETLMLDGRLIDQLKAAGFSNRTVNALVYSARIPSLEHLKTLPWGDGSPGSGLHWDLRSSPNMGAKGIAEVEAFRRGDDPRLARPSGPVRLSAVVEDETIAALDAWIERQPEPRPSRAQALVKLAAQQLFKA